MTLILIGRIVAAHGVKGQVKIKSLSTDLRTYTQLETAEGRIMKLRRLIQARDHFIATIDGIADRDHAEALRNTDLYVRRGQLKDVAGEVYLADLVGRQVLHEDKLLGVIAGFQNFGAGELMELDTGLLIPLRFATIGDHVSVDLPQGFLGGEDERAGARSPRSS
jgi:16S rRNA processing protein RimM